MTATITILGLLLLMSIIVNYILFIKVEKYEEIIDYNLNIQDSMVNRFYEYIEKFREIDNQGFFEADDSVGVAFNEIKQLTIDYQNLVTQMVQESNAKTEK